MTSNTAFHLPCTWLLPDGGQVAIFDATNTTKERRQFLVSWGHRMTQNDTQK